MGCALCVRARVAPKSVQLIKLTGGRSRVRDGGVVIGVGYTCAERRQNFANCALFVRVCVRLLVCRRKNVFCLCYALAQCKHFKVARLYIICGCCWRPGLRATECGCCAWQESIRANVQPGLLLSWHNELHAYHISCVRACKQTEFENAALLHSFPTNARRVLRTCIGVAHAQMR